jgi:glycosyltransferase involved in cell wall biosynthesis
MNTPIVSVAMAVYNCAAYVRDAIESALAQSFVDFEVVVVVDDDIDQTAGLGVEFGDERVRWLRPGRIGYPKAMNLALEHARAPLVAILDADDLALPHRLATSTAFLDGHPEIVLAGSGYRVFIDEAGRRTGRQDVLPLRWPEILQGLKAAPPSPFLHSSVMFRKAEILAAGGYNETISRYYDLDLLVRLATTHKLANIDAPLSLKRLHPGQYFLTRKDLPEDALSLAKIRAAAARL